MLQQLRSFFRLTAFVWPMLPGAPWKLGITFSIGLAELAILIAIPKISARILNAIQSEDGALFKASLLALLYLTFAQLVVGILNRQFILRINESVGNRLRATILRAVLDKRLSFFERHWLGDIIARVANESTSFKGFLTQYLQQIVLDLLTLFIVVVLLFDMNPFLALLTIAAAPISLITGYLARPHLENASKEVREKAAALTGYIQTWLTHPFALKSHNLEDKAAERFDASNDDFTRQSVHLGLLGVLVGGTNAVIIGIPSFIVLTYGGYIVLSGQLLIGDLFAFIAYSTYFNAPIQRLIDVWVRQIPVLYPIYERLGEFVADSENDTAPLDYPLEITGLHARNLEFRQSKERKFLLRVPEFDARIGEVVGVMGPNGSGKSSLLRLLSGVYRPVSGDVYLEDTRRDRYSPWRYRRLFSTLLQETALFNGSLQENVTLFADLPNTSRLDIIAGQVGLTDWVTSLPDHWATKINAGLAQSLSGGQMQRLGLARLFYSDAPICLLDEPENNLDGGMLSILEQVICKQHDKIIVLFSHSSNLLAMCRRVYIIRAEDEDSAFMCAEVNSSKQANCVVDRF